ncbi:MAG: copper resistance protein NlpE [Aequorivita sp.]
MKKIYILLLSIPLSIIGCKENPKNDHQENSKANSEKVIDGDTSKDLLNWNGTYKGLVPCASCPGILTTVKLNDDKSFEKSDFYLDSKDGYFKEKGTFTFAEDGSKITMISGEDTLVYTFDKNHSNKLSTEEKEISSELAAKYVLTKLSDAAVEFSDTPVKGFLIMGHEVSSFEPVGSSKVYWVKDSKDASLAKLYKEKTKNQEKPYSPVMAELVLKNSDATKEAFAKDYDGMADLVEVKSVETITPDNYSVN